MRSISNIFIVCALIINIYSCSNSHQQFTPKDIYYGCSTISQVTEVLYKQDYNYAALGYFLDKDIKKTTIKNYLQQLDPYGFVLTTEEIDEISNKYHQGIIQLYTSESSDKDKQVQYISSINCEAVFAIFREFQKKVNKKTPLISQIFNQIANEATENNKRPKIDIEAYPEFDDYNEISLSEANYLTELKEKIEFLLTLRYLSDQSQMSLPYGSFVISYILSLKDYLDGLYRLQTDNVISKFTNALLNNFSTISLFSDYEEIQNYNYNSAQEKKTIGLDYFVLDYGLFIYNVVNKSSADLDGKLKFGDLITGFKIDSTWYKFDKDNINGLLVLFKQHVDSSNKISLQISRFYDLSNIGSCTGNDNEDCTTNLVSFEVELDNKKTKLVSPDIPINHVYEIKESFTDSMVRVGYLRLFSFYGSESEGSNGSFLDTVQKLKELVDQDIEALLLDLRYNPGGTVIEVLQITNLFSTQPLKFYEKFPILKSYTHEKVGHSVLSYYDHPFENKSIVSLAKKLSNVPIVVLTNRQSASGSEFLAHALQVNNRAVVIGDDRTAGKGTFYIQQVREPGTYGTMITSGMFFGSDGSSVQKDGVKSDIIIPGVTSLDNDLYGLDEYAFDNETIEVEEDSLLDLGYRNQERILLLSYNSQKRVRSNPVSLTISNLVDYSKSKEHGLNYLYFDFLNKRELKPKDDFLKRDNYYDQFNQDNIYARYLQTRAIMKKTTSILKFNKGDIKEQYATKLYNNDYIMQEALNITSDLFLLCKSPARYGSMVQLVTSYSDSSDIGCVK